MKKAVSLLLSIGMCLCLCACGSVNLSVADVTEAFADCDGTLETETSGNNVTSFTYVVEGVNADSLLDREYIREAVEAIMDGDASQITMGQLMVSKAVLPVMSIDVLLGEEEENFSSDAFLEKIIGIICDGNMVEYDGWNVSTSVDVSNDSITIYAVSK